MPAPDSTPPSNSPARLRVSVRPEFLVAMAAGLFAAAAFSLSWWRWWTYQYASFDLAFYVQALWLAAHGQWHVSLLNVPLMGNHAEPIVFLLIPLFAVAPHPMWLVAVQVAVIASMPFTAWRIAQLLKFSPWGSAALAAATVLAPGIGYPAIHEFHPEALSAPLFLLLYESRLAGRLGRYWVWFLLTLACKENIALILVVWSGVHAFLERRRDARWQLRWNAAPALLALGWVALYYFVLSPALNGGRVDYANLYESLGKNGGEIATNLFTHPSRIVGALWHSLSSGNLAWVCLLSCAALPLLRPAWLVIAAPLLLQHLLSVRGSEWIINFHYPAPIAALFWIAATDAASGMPQRWHCAFWPAAASAILQFIVGPIREFGFEWKILDRTLWYREWEAPLVESLERDPALSVTSSMHYLSHLAARRELHSIHFVLKGTQTLSYETYIVDYHPDAVILDFGDAATFLPPQAYTHPAAIVDGRRFPSSDELLNRFLGRYSWSALCVNDVTVLRRGLAEPSAAASRPGTALFPHTSLQQARLVPQAPDADFVVMLDWLYHPPRMNIPWLKLELRGQVGTYAISLGMCSPESAGPTGHETKRVIMPPWIPPDRYTVTALFLDELRGEWDPSFHSAFLAAVPLGNLDWKGRAQR